MSVIATERIKLFTTRSPWWCMGVAAVLTLLIAWLLTALVSGVDEQELSIGVTQTGAQLSQMVMMVMAALAVTTEYRFGTIRTSFQAVPQRSKLLLGKTFVVAALSAVVGLVAAFGAWAVGSLVAGSADLAIDTGAEWRLVAGEGLVFALSAVIAVAIGVLLRQSAGAIAILLLWPALVEPLLNVIPRVGDDLAKWAPFANASSFLNQDVSQGGMMMGGPEGGAAAASNYALSPWAALLYFAAWAVGLLVISLVVANKRDA